jgi:RHS repeat-associated protein
VFIPSPYLACDGFGNRLAKTVNGVTTKYLVEDDVNPTGYPQVFEELTNGAVTRTYTYGLQRIDEEQVINNAWTTSYYGYDGFGTVRQLTNSAGAVTDTFEYDAFGNEITHTGTTPNNYLYRGEQFDPDLGLYYLRARYYNPQTGRFMSRDPRPGYIMRPIGLHKYLYANGDPVDYVDPSGRGAMLETGDIDLVIGQRSLPALTELVGGTAEQVAEWIDALNAALTEISAELAEAATEAGPQAWRLITSAVAEYNELLAEESALGGWVRELTCIDLSLVIGQIVETASEKPWLGHVVEIAEFSGCSHALEISTKF